MSSLRRPPRGSQGPRGRGNRAERPRCPRCRSSRGSSRRPGSSGPRPGPVPACLSACLPARPPPPPATLGVGGGTLRVKGSCREVAGSRRCRWFRREPRGCGRGLREAARREAGLRLLHVSGRNSRRAGWRRPHARPTADRRPPTADRRPPTAGSRTPWGRPPSALSGLVGGPLAAPLLRVGAPNGPDRTDRIPRGVLYVRLRRYVGRPPPTDGRQRRITHPP